MMGSISRLYVFMVALFISQYSITQVNNERTQIVLQGFWWDYYNSNYHQGWTNYLSELAPRLKQLGIDAIWIPPSLKQASTNSVGYAPFDHYDLGDKFQKSTVKTKLGDKDELLRMVAVMKANGIDVIQDIVLNHITGAGSSFNAGGQDPAALDDGSTSRYKNFRYVCFESPAYNETEDNYLGRTGRFSKNWYNFYPNPGNLCCTNEINSPFWGPDICYESNAFGLSSNATYNPNQYSDYMRTEMRNWLIWYKKQVGWDGVRIDAVKHFPSYATEDFLWNLQNGSLWANGGNDMYAVGEYVGGTAELDAWATAVQDRAGTFDFSLRNALTGIVNGLGGFDLGSVPGYQQNNRYRTVPFVNNHDTFRPVVDAGGNYINWNTGSEIGGHIEPNDPRKSLCYAIIFAVDGAPQVFFEDLFNIGYNSNRFDHDPKDPLELPVFSDVENIIWCHQNLRFKEGSYAVRWQANDALVIERQQKALIAVNDNFDQWQNLTGVQTSWPDGTVLSDYSGANGTSTATVYGGGLVDIAIPPCDGTALQGRRGYCIYAPAGITQNYVRPSERITQEWEMDNDLGDCQLNSLQQGGQLPNNSQECRIVGRVFSEVGESIDVELYPADATLPITLILYDKDCQPLDSISASGTIIHSFSTAESSWHTLKIRNATSSQNGQKCWVKVNYKAPEVVVTSAVKNKCGDCFGPITTSIQEQLSPYDVEIYPNPASEHISISTNANFYPMNYVIMSSDGKIVRNGKVADKVSEIDIQNMDKGVYFLNLLGKGRSSMHRFVKF